MLNQLLIPQPGTLHEALTFDDIDLSGKHYGIKSHKRATFLEFMGDILNKNPNVLTYMFIKRSNWVELMIVYTDGACYSHRFRLYSTSKYDSPNSTWGKFFFRDYITKMLAQSSYKRRIDYPHMKDFMSL